MVAIDQQIAGAAVDAVFRKLMCALHYKHTGNILPADAIITVKWCTNAGLPDFMTDEMKAFLAGLSEKSTLVRNGKDLSDQFDYRSRASDDGSASMYFIKFRQSIFGAGVVLSKPDEEMEQAAVARVETPRGPHLERIVRYGRLAPARCRFSGCYKYVHGLQTPRPARLPEAQQDHL